MKIGAGREADLELYQATLSTGESGVHLRVRRGQTREVFFLRKGDVAELIEMLQCAAFEMGQRDDR